jgi:hypothetical protein
MRAICAAVTMLALVLPTSQAEAYACNNRHYVNVSGHVVHSPSCGREHLRRMAICATVA